MAKKKPSLVDIHTELSKDESTIDEIITDQNIPDEERLSQLEKVIGQNLKAFYEVGLALQEIRDKGLYKLQGYSRFEDYCRTHWDMGRHYAYSQMESSVVVGNLLSNGQQFLPKNERQARALARLPLEQQPKAWERVLEIAPQKVSSEPKITTRLIEEVVADFLGKTPEIKPRPRNTLTYRLSLDEETDDALNEIFYKIRRAVDKDHRDKVTKELVAEVTLHVLMLEDSTSQERDKVIVERVLSKFNGPAK